MTGMSLIIRKPGILSTVQDLGRTGFRALGINPNGVMDRTAANIVNALVGNAEDAGVIETHFPAVEIEFKDDTNFAIGGADFCASVNDIPLRNWSSVNAKRGDKLAFRNRAGGARAYIAVAGGIEIGEWLGSASTNLAAAIGGFDGRALRTGDLLSCPSSFSKVRPAVGPSLIPRYSRFPTVRIVPGAEFDLLTPISETVLLKEQFTITNASNRMGFRLQGRKLSLYEPKELLSSAVTFGTVQLLPGGQLVILMADHQTTGGYPRIAGVIEADLPLLAQLNPGDKVMFKLVTVADAEKAAMRLARELAFLRQGIRFAGP